MPCRTWKRNWSGFFKRLGAFSQAQFGFKYSASSSNSGFGSTLCENEPSYRNAKTHRAERSRTIRPAPGNFLTSSLISFLRQANCCSAGLSFRQNGAARRPSWRPTSCRTASSRATYDRTGVTVDNRDLERTQLMIASHIDEVDDPSLAETRMHWTSAECAHFARRPVS